MSERRNWIGPGAVAACLAAAPAAAVEAPWWAGFYAGGSVGQTWGASSVRPRPFEPGATSVDRLKIVDNQFGALAGALAVGWNAAVGGRWLVGVEADLMLPPNPMDARRDVFTPAGAYSRADSVQSAASLRGRVGYGEGDWLGYVSGGPALARSFYTRTQVLGTSFGGLAMPGDVDTTWTWRAGWTIGAGVEARLSDAWSAKLEYFYARFGAADAVLPLAGQQVRSDLRVETIRAGLNYHFGAEGAPGGTLPNLDMLSIHGQTTQVGQVAFPFRAKYSGINSLDPNFQARETISATANIGFRPWIGTEFYFNPEPLQGFGLSQTHGLAGFSNGEAQKAGFSYPHYSTARAFVRQTFGLGGAQESVDDGANQFAGKIDVSRVTITAGKFAVTDIFDNNQYAHDQRTGFLNFAMWDGGAFDYAADQKGYTWGAAVELNQPDWAARAGYFLLPAVPNGIAFDTRLARRGQYVGELEARYPLFGQVGKLRVTGWFSRAFSGSFEEVNANPAFGGDITLTRRSRPAHGFVVNLEQPVTDDFGLFGRLSWRDGRNEIVSFTDIDRSAAFGGVLKGTTWGRPKDRIGAAFAVNGLRDGYRTYLANGGLGINIGDGALTYRRESIVETYYLLQLNAWTSATLDYQFIANPGYNSDRGPVSIAAVRLHTEF